MSDPYLAAVAQFSEAIERLKLELEKDAREFVQRITKLETLPRSIDLIRDELREFSERCVTREQLATAIELALAKYSNEELKRGNKSHSASLGPNTKFRLEDRKSNRDFWAKIIVAAIMAVVAVLTTYNTAAIKRVESKQEIQDKK